MSNTKIEFYCVVSNGTPETLAGAVQRKMEFGWQPYGPMVILPGLGTFHQPMVQYEPTPKQQSMGPR